MTRLINLYKIALKNWVYMFFGIISLFLYALFSGMNVTLIKPLLDYIFTQKGGDVLYQNIPDFFQALISQTNSFFSVHNLSSDFTTYNPLLLDYENIMKATDSYVLLKVIVMAIIVLFTLKNLTFYFNKVMFINLRGKTVKNLPDWYKITPVKEGFRYQASEATSQSMQLAVDKARVAAVSNLSQMIKSEWNGYTKRVQEETGMGSESKLLDQFTSTQENVISNQLEGIMVKEKDPSGK